MQQNCVLSSTYTPPLYVLYCTHLYLHSAAEHIYINEKHGKYLHHNDEAIVLYV